MSNTERTIEDRLKDIIVDKLSVERKNILPTSDFRDDLGADSLDTVELIMEVDKEFKISIPDEEMENIRNVQDVINLIVKRVNASVTNN